MKSSEITQLPGRLLTSRFPPDPDPSVPTTTVTPTNPTAPHAAASFTSLPAELIQKIGDRLYGGVDKTNFAAVNRSTYYTLQATRAELKDATNLSYRLGRLNEPERLGHAMQQAVGFLSRPNPACPAADRQVREALGRLVNQDPAYWRKMPLKIRLEIHGQLQELAKLLQTAGPASASLHVQVMDLHGQLLKKWFIEPDNASSGTGHFVQHLMRHLEDPR